MNPLNAEQFDSLQESIKWSLRQWRFPRRKRIESVKQFTGSHYLEGGSEKKLPVNMLKLAVCIYNRMLAPKAPRVLITTKRNDLRPFAANFELAINQIPDEIDLSKTFRKYVTEALFSPFGILKIGISTIDHVMGYAYGKTFVDLITIDDYFCDMSVSSLSEIQYEGNDYWVDYEEAMDSEWIESKVRSDLKEDDFTLISPEGEDRAEGLINESTAKLFRKKLWVRDVWLTKEKLFVTYGITSKKIFRIIDWDGPDHSPYYKLGYVDVPGNILPLPNVSVWRDLSELGNALFRKLANQADAQKRCLGFDGSNDESVEAFQKASDGDGIQYNGRKPEILKAGGVDGNTLAFYLQVRDLNSYFAGNLDSLGGLSPLTETVGQDRLLSDAANAQLKDMAEKTNESIKEVFQALAWYEWHDPLSNRELEKPIPGTKLSIPVQWNHESKIGELDLYDLKIDVYSLQDDTPGTKLQKLMMFTKEIVMPLYPLIQQAGGTIDVQEIFELAAKYADFPELSQLVVFAGQPGIEQSASQQSHAPANTSREYIRTGRPGITRQGQTAVMQQMLMGGNPQQAQRQQVAANMMT